MAPKISLPYWPGGITRPPVPNVDQQSMGSSPRSLSPVQAVSETPSIGSPVGPTPASPVPETPEPKTPVDPVLGSPSGHEAGDLRLRIRGKQNETSFWKGERNKVYRRVKELEEQLDKSQDESRQNAELVEKLKDEISTLKDELSRWHNRVQQDMDMNKQLRADVVDTAQDGDDDPSAHGVFGPDAHTLRLRIKRQQVFEDGVLQVTTASLECMEVIEGTYCPHGEHHGKICWKREKPHQEQNVFISFWDGRCDPSWSGWWFGVLVGGCEVFAQCLSMEGLTSEIFNDDKKFHLMAEKESPPEPQPWEQECQWEEPCKAEHSDDDEKKAEDNSIKDSADAPTAPKASTAVRETAASGEAKPGIDIGSKEEDEERHREEEQRRAEEASEANEKAKVAMITSRSAANREFPTEAAPRGSGTQELNEVTPSDRIRAALAGAGLSRPGALASKPRGPVFQLSDQAVPELPADLLRLAKAGDDSMEVLPSQDSERMSFGRIDLPTPAEADAVTDAGPQQAAPGAESTVIEDEAARSPVLSSDGVLDEAWVECIDADGRPYFWNRRSRNKSCTWELPAGVRAKWRRIKAADGRDYYLSVGSREACWVMPKLEGPQMSSEAASSTCSSSRLELEDEPHSGPPLAAMPRRRSPERSRRDTSKRRDRDTRRGRSRSRTSRSASSSLPSPETSASPEPPRGNRRSRRSRRSRSRASTRSRSRRSRSTRTQRRNRSGPRGRGPCRSGMFAWSPKDKQEFDMSEVKVETPKARRRRHKTTSTTKAPHSSATPGCLTPTSAAAGNGAANRAGTKSSMNTMNKAKAEEERSSDVNTPSKITRLAKTASQRSVKNEDERKVVPNGSQVETPKARRRRHKTTSTTKVPERTLHTSKAGAVRSITSITAWYIDKVIFTMSDNTTQEWGSSGGNLSQKLDLREGEYIRAVGQRNCQCGYLGSALVFHLSSGRMLTIEGTSGRKRWQNIVELPADAGQQVIGLQFDGSRLANLLTMSAPR